MRPLPLPRRLLAGLTAAVAVAFGPVVVASPALADPEAGPDLALVAPAPIPLTAPECPEVLAEGEFDGCVTELQHLLDAHGADLLGTGYYGPDTADAVRDYQESVGLPTDGTVGPPTKAALYAAAPPEPLPLESPDCPALVVEGEVDGCVTSLQMLLVGRGYPLTVTGAFDPATRSSVASYQAFVGLLASGQADRATVAALLGTSYPAPRPIDLDSPVCADQLVLGARGGCVTRLQELLSLHGAQLPVTGQFDAATSAAVIRFQQDHRLVARGVVGEATKAALSRNGQRTQATAPAPAIDGDLQARIVGYARAVEAGAAGQGWTGEPIPYVWGGGHRAQPGPSRGTCYLDASGRCTDEASVGLDCSGFARWVYALAYGQDVLGPGNSQQQLLQLRPAGSPQPGDLVFFGSDADHVHHVGVYVGDGLMVNAPTRGTVVRTDRVSRLPDLVGFYRMG